jgi:NAD(P)-dependent dehydrogenase (short-subunit alcohol dehydrogenase family)
MTDSKVAFITGAARGIGRAIALDLARHGFDIVATARSLESPTFADKPGTLQETAERVRGYGRRALPLKLDLLSEDDIRAGFARAVAEFGRIDVLVTSGNYVEPGPEGTYSNKFVDVPWDAFERHIRITGLSTLYLNQLAARQMMIQGSGIIANVTQNAIWLNVPELVESMPLPGAGMPGMAIAVMRGITDRIPASVKRELAPHGIAVMTLDPGMTLSVDPGLWPTVETVGYRPDLAHSVVVPARAMTYVATRDDPMPFSGSMVIAIDLVRDRALLTEEEINPDWREGIQDIDSVPVMRRDNQGP